MRTFSRTINENRKKQLKETNFMKVVYNPKGSGCHTDHETLVGYVDRNTMLIKGTQEDGMVFFEIRRGSKYSVGGDGASYSKRYEYESLPPRWREHADELVIRKKEGFDDLVAESLNRLQVLENKYAIDSEQWEVFKNACMESLDVNFLVEGDMNIIYDPKRKAIFAKWDEVKGLVWTNVSEKKLEVVINRKDTKALKEIFREPLNESLEDAFESGDRVKIKSGEFKNQIGVLDLIMSDTYIIKLKNDTSIEYNKDEVEKVK